MQLVTDTYLITNTFPKEEVFGLTSQIKRGIISVACNIAEGFGRKSGKEFVRFLNISIGSLFEYQTQIEIARNIKFISEEDFNQLYEKSREIEIMKVSFSNKINH